MEILNHNPIFIECHVYQWISSITSITVYKLQSEVSKLRWGGKFKLNLVAEGLLILHVNIYENPLEFQWVMEVYNVGHFWDTKVKVWTLVIAPLTWVRLVTSSALQSRKWQLIGMSQWCRSALCGHSLPVPTDSVVYLRTIFIIVWHQSLGFAIVHSSNLYSRLLYERHIFCGHSMIVRTKRSWRKPTEIDGPVFFIGWIVIVTVWKHWWQTVLLHFSLFGLVLLLSGIAIGTRRPRVIIVSIYVSSSSYYCYT